MIKIIDKLLIKSFIPPLFMAFFIALFVLIMQTLWLYIDTIVGKGVGILLMMEMIGYLSVSLIPMALPIAIIIGAVMVFGNLGERYELSSLKSAGVSLIRIMLPLMVLTGMLSVFSFFCSDNLIPVSLLKFKSRLYDIKTQKPTLNLETGLFNYDFGGYVIRIGEKGDDNRTIKDVMIYDHNTTSAKMVNLIMAERGEMYITQDKRYLVMHLEDVNQYQDIEPSKKRKNKPFMRSASATWEKVFDLSEFDIEHTDENRFMKHHQFLSSRQLAVQVDTFISKLNKSIVFLQDDLTSQVSLFPAETSNKKVKRGISRNSPLKQVGIDTATTFMATFIPKDIIKVSIDAGRKVKNFKNKLSRTITSNNSLDKSRRKHLFEQHSKYAWAVACFIFLFIGAPMGAIVRKGGFGYPLLIAIIFFMLFIVLTILFRELNDARRMEPVLAVWLPNLIIFPLGLALTVQAMNDSRMMDPMAIFINFKRKLGIKVKDEDIKEKTI
jgi:lipopolysaccharide export system permease protein